MSKTERLFFIVSLCTASVLSLAIIWNPTYLPMTDLPQHAEQLFIVLNQKNPSFAFRNLYSVNWLTPYGLGLAIAAATARVIGILPALKLVITMGVLGLPLSMLILARAAGSDSWWSLFGFPTAFGFSFYWGFIDYIFAVPLAILFFALMVQPQDRL